MGDHTIYSLVCGGEKTGYFCDVPCFFIDFFIAYAINPTFSTFLKCLDYMPST